jgi:hypothetical protein
MHTIISFQNFNTKRISSLEQTDEIKKKLALYIEETNKQTKDLLILDTWSKICIEHYGQAKN